MPRKPDISTLVERGIRTVSIRLVDDHALKAWGLWSIIEVLSEGSNEEEKAKTRSGHRASRIGRAFLPRTHSSKPSREPSLASTDVFIPDYPSRTGVWLTKSTWYTKIYLVIYDSGSVPE